jgi:hypothetical protein
VPSPRPGCDLLNFISVSVHRFSRHRDFAPPFKLHSSETHYKPLKDNVNASRLIKAGKRSSFV